MELTRNQQLFIHLVRGLSALAVMVGHSLNGMAGPPALAWYEIQSCAVVVFFVLSGFLICWSTARKPDYSFVEYFIDRFARIFVPFVPALLLTLGLDLLSGSFSARNSLSNFMANIAMLQGIRFDRLVSGGPYFQPYGTNSPLWTVAVEWQIYMAFGLVFFSTRLRGIGIAVAILLAIPALGMLPLYSLRENLSTIWILAACLAVPIAIVSPEQARRFAWGALALAIAALVFKIAYLSRLSKFPPYDVQLMLAVAFFILSAIVLLKSVKADLFGRIERPIRFLSDISYSLYLIHYPIMVAYISVVPTKWTTAEWLGYNVIGLVAAWVFTLAFDHHHSKVGRWLKEALLTKNLALPAMSRP